MTEDCKVRMGKSLVIKMHNCASTLYRHKIPLLPGFLNRIMRVLFSCDIPYTVVIGKNTIFAHNALGCVVNEDAVIGENCKILQNVTIGGRGEGNGVPIIGDNVLIGAGACILGGVTIGNGAKIGANAVVVKDVPEGATVVGIPAKVI